MLRCDLTSQRYLLLGGTGFLGCSIAKRLVELSAADVLLYSRSDLPSCVDAPSAIRWVAGDFLDEDRFDDLLQGIDAVFHLVSPTNVSNTNLDIGQEIAPTLQATCRLLDACVRAQVKKVIFVSSGGTVYGASGKPPFSEDDPCEPVSAYGLQKYMIEQLLAFYRRMSGLDCRVLRLSNPYGPLQNPEGQIGVVTKAIYKALRNEEVTLFGDGSIVRDFLYIDDAVDGVIRMIDYDGQYQVFNLGSGVGVSISDVLASVEAVLGLELRVQRVSGRKADVPAVWLDMSRYEREFGEYDPISLERGIDLTASYLADQGV